MAFGAPGFFELLILFSMFSASGAMGIMGLPPGDRDAALPQTAPADALLYVEWAERGPGKEGAKGIDGFAADPEIRKFVTDVWRAIETGVQKEAASGSPAGKVAADNIPPLIRLLLNRSGCLWVAMDEKALPAGPPQRANPLMFLGAMRFCLVINGGKQADAIAGHLQALVSLLPPDLRKANLQRQPLPLPASGLPPGFSLTLHREGNYFLLAVDKGVLNQALAGLKGTSKGLAGNERFAQALKRVAYPRTAGITYVDFRSGIRKVEAVFGKSITGIVKMLGLDALDVLVSATGVVEGEIRVRSFLGTGGKTTGVLALFSGRGIQAADFAHVPADSDLVLAYSVNVKNILSAARQIVAAADPVSKQRLDALIKQFEEELGLKLEDDLLAAFGDVWVLHDSKSAGGVYLTSAVLSLEVKNYQKAQDVFTKLMDVLEESLPKKEPGGFRRLSVSLKTGTFAGQTIHYINIVGDDIPFAPAFCLTKTHLLAAPHPQALKSHLRFLQSKNKRTFAQRFQTEFPHPTGDVLSFSYFETNRLLQALSGLAPYFAQVVFNEVQQAGIDIDIFSFPSARAVLPYFGNLSSVSVRTKDGLVGEARNTQPLSAVGPVMTVLPYFFFGMRAMKREVPGAVPAPRKGALPAQKGPAVAVRRSVGIPRPVSSVSVRRKALPAKTHLKRQRRRSLRPVRIRSAAP